MADVKVVLATPLAPELRHLITDSSAGIELLVDDDLLPAQRFPGDHEGDPAFRRSTSGQQAFEDLLARADVLYGIPDTDPAALAPAVRANPSLRWVQTMAAGGGAQVKAAGLTAHELARVVFTTSAGVHGGPLAEFALLGILGGAKDLARLQALQRDHVWGERWAMREMSDHTVLVVGLGGIGAEIARLCKAFGARVLGVRRTAGEVEHVDEVHPEADLPELVGRADAIVLTLPGTAATTGLYGTELIAATKPGATVVNVGRGTVINEDALVRGLQSGQLGAAFLDVTAVEPLPASSLLWSLPQVVIAPHTAALSAHEDRRIAKLFADNLSRFLAGRPLRNVVDTEHFY